LWLPRRGHGRGGRRRVRLQRRVPRLACGRAEYVYSVEYHDSLAAEARETLAELGSDGVSVRAGDGRAGWPTHAPFDRAYLTCAAADFPAAVVDQVATGGLLLAPIGDDRQRLIRARKNEDGSLDRSSHGGVRFVPLQ